MTATTEKALVSSLLLAVTVPVFLATGEIASTHRPAAWLVTRWDSSIPLVPSAIWFYLSWYMAPWLLLAAPRQEFRRVSVAIALAFVVCNLCYLAFPVSVERSAVLGSGLSESALRMLYQHDPPWNTFPSFHAAVCAILFGSSFPGGFSRQGMQVWMSAVCLACVLTKQHYMLDILAGLLVGFSAIRLATGLVKYRGIRRPVPASVYGPTARIKQ
jgi:PAP2 superfamily